MTQCNGPPLTVRQGTRLRSDGLCATAPVVEFVLRNVYLGRNDIVWNYLFAGDSILVVADGRMFSLKVLFME